MDFQLLKCLGKPDAGNGNDSESQGAEREKRLDELFTEQLGKKKWWEFCGHLCITFSFDTHVLTVCHKDIAYDI